LKNEKKEVHFDRFESPGATYFLALRNPYFGKRCLKACQKCLQMFLLTSRKHTIGSLMKCFGEYNGSILWMATCYWPLSNRNPA